MSKKLLVACLVILTSKAEPPPLIQGIKATRNKLVIEVEKSFKKKYLTGDFFAEYDADIDLESLDYSLLSMPLLMNVISIVWVSGKTYTVKEMDTELYYSLSRVKEVFKTMYPTTKWNGEVIPQKLVEHSSIDNPQHTALLFSGGLDSVSSFLNHLDKQQLLITAWGHWDLPLGNKSLWKTRTGKIKELAQEYGYETSFIRSNYSSILNWQYLSTITPEIKKWRLGAVEGLGWAGLTAPLLQLKGCPNLRIASSHTWLYPYPAAGSPYIDNNLHFFGKRVLHDQFDMTRLQKTMFIAQKLNKKPPFLKICSLEKGSDRNCCQCRKCIITIAGFLAIGENPKRYGLPIDTTTALKKMLELVKPQKLNYYTILYFKEMQGVLQQQKAEGKKIRQEFEKLLAIDFNQKIPFDVLKQRKLNWYDMQPLLPELEVPQINYETLTIERSTS